MHTRRIGIVGLLAALALVAAGCSNKPVPTEGVVTLDGKPVEGATVNFHVPGEEEGRMAWGTTDKDGKFQLSTMGDNDGAYAREYKVTVAKYVPLKPEAEAAARRKLAKMNPEDRMTLDDMLFEVYGTGPRVKSVYPEQYSHAEKTPFTIKVPHDGPVKLEMTSR